MAANAKSSSKMPKTGVAKDPSLQPGTLKGVGGSASDEWNNRIANDTINTLWLKNSDAETRERQMSGAIAGLVGIKPPAGEGGNPEKARGRR